MIDNFYYIEIIKFVDCERKKNRSLKIARILNDIDVYDPKTREFKFFIQVMESFDPESDPYLLNNKNKNRFSVGFGFPDDEISSIIENNLVITEKMKPLRKDRIKDCTYITADEVLNYFSKTEIDKKYKGKIFKISREELRKIIEHALAIEQKNNNVDINLLYYFRRLNLTS